MAKHELTEKQIAALQKLGVTSFGFYQIHIPVRVKNISFCTHGKFFDRLSKAIAVDAYTSAIGKSRFRECYDDIKKLNKRGKLGNTEVFLRLLNERAQYYFAVLCGTAKLTTVTHTVTIQTTKAKQASPKYEKGQAKLLKRLKAIESSRLHAYIPDSQFQSQYRSTLASHNLIKDEDYEHGLSDID